MIRIKAVFFTFICLTLICVACQKKAVPLVTERKAPPPNISRNAYPPKETVAPDTVAGKRIYANRCGKCHALPTPAQYSVTRWDNILPIMIPRARLTNEEALHVRTWLLANAG
jgi:cytochrome c5